MLSKFASYQLLIALGAYSISLVEISNPGPAQIVLSLLVFFCTLFIYLLHYHQKDQYRTQKRNFSPYIFLLVVSLPLIIYLLTSGQIRQIIILSLLFPMAFLYVFDFFNFGKLNRVPYLKLFILSLCWSVVSLIQVPEKIILDLPYFTTRFLFFFALVIPFDIRDQEKDKSNHVKTLSIALGTNNMLCIQLATIMIALFLSFYYLNQIDLLLYSFSFVWIGVISRIKKLPTLIKYSILLDGTLLIYSFLKIINWNYWIESFWSNH